jgi:hypothetical protein
VYWATLRRVYKNAGIIQPLVPHEYRLSTLLFLTASLATPLDPCDPVDRDAAPVQTAESASVISSAVGGLNPVRIGPQDL